MTKEGNLVSRMGSLAVVVKGKKAIEKEGSESDLSDCELLKEDYALMISNPRRFAKKNFSHSKKQNWQGSYSPRKVKDDSSNSSQNEEVKKEMKVIGDFDYDCNCWRGKKHLAKECMLRRLNKKKEEEDDETYYLRKLEEIKKKKSIDNVMPALIVQEDEYEFGRVEVWSSDSKDKEVCRPTHERSFVAKDDASQFCGRCLMVSNEASKLRGYATNSDRVSDNCFAVKPVLEQIS